MGHMKTAVGSASAKPASTIPSEPLVTDGFNEARSEATEAIAAKGRERGFVTSEDVLAGLPELQETGAEKATEGAIEGVEEELKPSSSTLRTAAKGAATAAALGAAAAAAREFASRVGDSRDSGDKS